MNFTQRKLDPLGSSDRKQVSLRGLLRGSLRLAWACWVVLACGHSTWAQEAGEVETPPAQSAAAFFARYRSAAEVAALLERWQSEHPELASSIEVQMERGGAPGSSFQGPPCLEISSPQMTSGTSTAGAGGASDSQRPAILVLGGLNGRSLVGGEAALTAMAKFLSQPETLPNNVRYLFVPWAAPLALDSYYERSSLDGRNLKVLDEDFDGLTDEDGPDDIDGDGALLQMLVPDAQGLWTRREEDRLVRRAGPADSPRYSLTWEGRDDDEDGLFNEDPVGGIVLDRNFPVNRLSRWEDPRGGALPLSNDTARWIAELCLQQNVVVSVVLQGDHGRLVWPRGAREHNLSRSALYELSALHAEVSERADLDLLTQEDFDLCQPRHGAAIDWMFAVGILAVELSPWGPFDPKRSALAESSEAGESNAWQVNQMSAPGWTEREPLVGSWLDQAWLSWVDNQRGGLGFARWRPVELAEGIRGFIGGWEPFTRWNPPEELLAEVCAGPHVFLSKLSERMPRLELVVSNVRRDGELLRFSARVHNRGSLPTGMPSAVRSVGGPQGNLQAAKLQDGLRITLDVPADARLLAGKRSLQLPRLMGQAFSDEFEWVVLMTPEAALHIEVSAGWSAPLRREIKR